MWRPREFPTELLTSASLSVCLSVVNQCLEFGVACVCGGFRVSIPVDSARTSPGSAVSDIVTRWLRQLWSGPWYESPASVATPKTGSLLYDTGTHVQAAIRKLRPSFAEVNNVYDVLNCTSIRWVYTLEHHVKRKGKAYAFTCDLVTCVLDCCRRILNMRFFLRWPFATCLKL